jgi:predicted dehydrogenase
MVDKVNIGFIGVGNIFPQYIKWTRTFEILNVVAVADMDFSRAEARAKEFDIPHAYTVEQLLADPSVEIIINLTVPQSHAEVDLAILNAGKHAYGEKPLGLSREEGQKILNLAAEKHLLVGCAPDTFLGGGIQTARKVIDDGLIGRPVAATAFMLSHGPESWHPNPEFYYKLGGGPMFDMGPYYLTALVNLLGPVKRVTASAQISFPERIATSKEKNGLVIKVDVPTHVAGIMDFASGAVGTIITSFDVWAHHVPLIEIHGSEGSLGVPDPNNFGGKVLLRRWDEKEWREVEHSHSDDVGRGIGVADMAYAIRSGRANRASGQLAFHVLDLMQSFHEASAQDKHIAVTSTVKQPDALPVGLAQGTLDA